MPGAEHYSAHGLWHHNSGKTLAGCMEAITLALAYPGSRGMVARWAHRELMETTWRTLLQITPRALIKSLTESPQKCKLELHAPGGKVSTIVGYPLSNMDAVFSMELSWAYLDEGGQIPGNKGPGLWKLIESRLRGPIGPYRAWVTGNPNGRDWLWRKFVGQGLRGYQMFRAPTKQNVYNPTNYEQDLRRGADPNWVRRFLDAEFNEFEGAVYWNWSDALQIFEPFPVPAHWPAFLAIDPGFADPTAALVFVTDEHGNVFVTQEYYRAERLVSDQCRDILGMIGSSALSWAVIDPAAKGRDGVTGKSVSDQYREGGLPVLEANNRLFDGIAAVQEAMKVDPDRQHPITGKMGAPRLYVARRCTNLLDQIHSYRWGPNGKPMEGADHLVDALRYGMMRRPHAAGPVASVKLSPSAEAFFNRARFEGIAAELEQIGAAPMGGLG